MKEGEHPHLTMTMSTWSFGNLPHASRARDGNGGIEQQILRHERSPEGVLSRSKQQSFQRVHARRS